MSATELDALTYEVRIHDVEYRRAGVESWLARIYEPVGEGPFPALLRVHGGAWKNRDRTLDGAVDQALAGSGLVIASVDFRSSDQEPYPASMADINYATRWLKAHATQFKASPTAIGGLGGSSGGHLVMLSAMRPRDPRYTVMPLAEAPDADASLAYVLLVSPATDPFAVVQFWRELDRQDGLATIMDYFVDDDGLREANPQLILERQEPAELPPILILHGMADDQAPPAMVARFAATYSQAGGLVELALFPNEGHGLLNQLGPARERGVKLMQSFVARQLAAIDAGWS
jgi:acetyl esterase/lipase